VTTPISILLLTKGHPFEKGPFLEWMDSIPGAEITHVEHPAAHDFIAAGLGSEYDLWLHYDMPGYRFGGDSGVEFFDPSQAFKNAYLDRLCRQRGPCLYLHHALAGWPTWPDYGDIIGGRFLYRAGQVRGAKVLDSGYRHDVTYTAAVEDHPVTRDVDATFDVTDELYLAQIFEADVVPLVRSDYAFTADNFYSASHAVDGNMFSNAGWDHPDGSNLVGWVKHYGKAPIGYLQMGDAPQAYNNPQLTKLLHNMSLWLASEDAKEWAKQRDGGNNAEFKR